MKDGLVRAIKAAFNDLEERDGYLLERPIEEGSEYDSRELHEVCINHRLSNHLEAHFFREYPNEADGLFFDIEFNREGGCKKELEQNGKSRVVRPDIILHNRKSGDEKRNVLVVECKKVEAGCDERLDDEEKIKAFIDDQNYRYEFGLQVVYGKGSVSGRLYYRTQNGIQEEELNR